MDVKERIRRIKLLEKMNQNIEYASKLELKDKTVYKLDFEILKKKIKY